jgi:predicted transcriptional regulator
VREVIQEQWQVDEGLIWPTNTACDTNSVSKFLIGKAMSSTQFSVRLPDEQKEFLDSLASAKDRSRNHLISAAVSKMMENYKFVLMKIDEGDADYEAGRVISMEEAERRTQAVIDQAKQRKSL